MPYPDNSDIKGQNSLSDIQDLSEAETSLCHGIIKNIIKFNNELGLAQGLPDDNIESEIKPAIIDYMLNIKKNIVASVSTFCEDQLCELENSIEDNINSVEDSSGMRM